MIEEYKFERSYRNQLYKGTTYIIPGDPNLGYNFGFAIYIPDTTEEVTNVLMYSPNTGCAGINDEGKLDSKTKAFHLKDGIEAIRQKCIGINHGKMLAHSLNIPVITPLVPRVVGYYTQAMGSYVFNNDTSYLKLSSDERNEEENKLTDEEINEIKLYCYNIFEQVALGLPHALDFIRSKGFEVEDKIIAGGYSAGSKFANYFTAIHPECVKATFGGGIGGLMIIPQESIEVNGAKITLKYPLGIADIKNFDKKAFDSIPQYYYMGGADFNDPAEARIIDGKLMPWFGECYSPEEIGIIHTYLGKNGLERFDFVSSYYSDETLFKIFPGEDHNSVCSANKDGICISDEFVCEFVKSVLENDKKHRL